MFTLICRILRNPLLSLCMFYHLINPICSLPDMAESIERLEDNQAAQAETTKKALKQLDSEIDEISKLSVKRSEVRTFSTDSCYQLFCLYFISLPFQTIVSLVFEDYREE
jgi:hypothetical protein